MEAGTDQRADDREHPEEPQLLEVLTAHEKRRPRRSGRVHRGVGHRNGHEVDEGEAEPDAERGAVVKAYVVLTPGVAGDDALIAALQAHVKGQLAPYEYPKEIEFIDTLPMTTTGKVQRRVLRLQEEERFKSQSSA